MRVLFVVAGLERGGVERQLANLAPGLSRRGHHVTVAVPFPGDYYQRVLEESGVKVIPLTNRSKEESAGAFDSLGARFSILKALWDLLRKSRFDVVHGYGFEPNMALAILKPLHRVPVVWGIRHSTPGSRTLKSMLETMYSRTASMIIVNSQAGRRASEAKGFSSSTIHVIENGIDTDRFTVNPDWRAEVRRELGVSPNSPLIGIVGRLHPVKDHDTFLRSAKLVADTVPDVKFVVIGRDFESRRELLQSLAEELGIDNRLIWTGLRNDVEHLLNAIDVCVMSSRREGFPNVVAEAMACGVPCVVTDAGDAARIVGDRNRVVAPGDFVSLAAKIIEVLSGVKSTSPFELRSSVVRQWAIERMVTRTEAALREIAP